MLLLGLDTNSWSVMELVPVMVLKSDMILLTIGNDCRKCVVSRA